jgi:mRNA-degrading endonuclease toxin of MazEF toxin-antitoxin module
MHRGEVWRVRLPPASGHRQAGERPAVLVQDDRFISSLPTVFVIPFTSNLSASRFAGTLLVQPDGKNGLTVPSIAMVFQFGPVDKRDCVRQIGSLDVPTLDQLLDQLDQLTGR